MVSEQEPEVLVCTPVSAGPASVDSITLICDQCGTQVWASKAMQRDPKVRAMKPRCFPCVYPGGYESIDPKQVRIHPTAIREAAAAIAVTRRKEKDDA